MIYVVRFGGGERLPLLVGGATPDEVTERVEAATGLSPIALHEVPDELVFAEVMFADPLGQEEEDNPANVTEMGCVLEPSEDFTVWLEAVDELPLPEDASTAPTLPAPEEDGGADAGV